jgi:hypothetical protein
MMPPSKQLMLGPAHIPHEPPWQCSDEPVHSPVGDITSVVQHICPSVPQSLGTITHMRIAGLQTSPSMQTLCGAHGWPMPPIVVLPPHMPAVHVSPPEHVAPGAQQGCPMLPHIIGMVHVPPMQMSAPPLEQPVAPAQHGCPAAPHAVHIPV